MKNISFDSDRLLFFGFCALFFLMPVATSPASIAGVFVVAIWVLSGKFLNYKSWIGRRWALPVIFIVALTWLGILWSPDIKTAMIFAGKTRLWLYALAASVVILTRARTDMLVKSYIGGVSFTSTLFILQLLGLLPMRKPYSVGLLNRWAHISFSLLITFALLLISYYFGRTNDRKEKVLWGFLMVINFVALSMLLSDSGHLAFILLSPIIAFNLLPKKNIVLAIALGIVISGALFLSPITQQRLRDAIEGTESYFSPDTHQTPVGTRYYMWTGAIKIYKESPIFGVGTGGYQSRMRELRVSGQLPKKLDSEGRVEDPIHPHNSLLYMAVSFGILGIVALIWFFISVFKENLPLGDSLGRYSVITFMLVLIIGSLTDTQILQHQTGALMSAITGFNFCEDTNP